MPAKILLVVHQAHSDPGRVASELDRLGFSLDLRRPSCGDCLPADLGDHSAAVIFGGPMSANDDHLDFIRTELDFIGRVLASGKPYLGICLGAQLLARHLGARVACHPEGIHEIGYHPITPTADGAGLFEPDFHAYQWHGEGFEVPAGATLLATGASFPHQAIRYGNAYGLQFHPEVTPTIMDRWIGKENEKLSRPGAQSAAEQIALRGRHEPGVERWLQRFLHHWLDLGREAQPLLAAAG